MEKLPQHGAAFSKKALVDQKAKTFKNLKEVDLETVSQKEISEYLFIFDSVFLSYITPLNFAFYNKYLIEEMVIFPIVAILQKS